MIIIATMICSFFLSIGQVDKTECKSKLEELGNIYEYDKIWEYQKPMILSKKEEEAKQEVSIIYNCFNTEVKNIDLGLGVILISIKNSCHEEIENKDYINQLRKSKQKAMICQYNLDKEIVYFKYDRNQSKDVKIQLLNLLDTNSGERLKGSKSVTKVIKCGKCEDCPF